MPVAKIHRPRVIRRLIIGFKFAKKFCRPELKAADSNFLVNRGFPIEKMSFMSSVDG